MLCEMCGKNKATFFYKQTKNGYTTEKNLCAECAEKQGFGTTGSMFELDGFTDDFFGGLLGSFFDGREKAIPAANTCPFCGMTLGELLSKGKVGCAECYKTFRVSLMPTVQKLHGNVAHCGKRPGGMTSDVKVAQKESKKTESGTENTLEQLKAKLLDAIEKQEYEDAAKYRDKIKELEKRDGIGKKENAENAENAENGKDDEQ